MNEIAIPRYIDSPMQFFVYELDEALIFFSLFSIGIMMGGLGTLIMMFVGHYIVKMFQRFKNGEMDGVLQHLVYWQGLMPLNKKYLDGLERETFL